jgi:indole-3-acetate monooxygenase
VPVDGSPLYRHRWMFFVNIGAVPLGIARAAIDEAVLVSQTKVTMPEFTHLREEPTVQDRVARAEILVRSARAYLWDAVGVAWDALQDGVPVDDAWLGVRLATTNAFRSSKEAVTLLYEAVGTTGVYSSSMLDRSMRDLITVSQHVLVQPKTLVAAGRALVGLPPNAIGF